MAITVKHSKVSTIPDTDDTSLVRPSDWNADHTLVGTIDVANGGTGASTLTGYVKGNGTSAMTASATIPSGDVSGLGTMSTQNANAVAITGGTINNTSIGATTPSTGTFAGLTVQDTTDSTKKGTFDLSNLPTATTYAYTLPNVTGTLAALNLAQTFSATQTFSTGVTMSGAGAAYNIGTSGTTGVTTIGGVNTTSILTVGRSTLSQTTNIQAGATASGSTKTINIGTAGLSGSTTTIAIGSAVSGSLGTTTIQAPTVNIGQTATQFQVTNTASAVNYHTFTGTITGFGPVHSVAGSDTNIPLVLQPKGTGALQAQQTDSTTTGGNARGANAVDWQTSRSGATRVASALTSVVAGGDNNGATATNSVVSGGTNNVASGAQSFIGSGNGNAVSSPYANVVGGFGNTGAGYYNFIGAGQANSGTAQAAVTTQATSTITSGSTAVTLSGSNANIRVGQLITGTPIATNTYVAAISGTSLTLSQNATSSSNATLSFFTPHGVVVGGGNNQATGSYSFIGGGGDAGTAANRNVASGDWSFVGGGGRNTASGTGSVICGGGSFGSGFSANTASGVSAFIGAGYNNISAGFTGGILCGTNNTQNGNFSAVLGGASGATRAIVSNLVFPSGNPLNSTGGATQAAVLVLARQTTDATPTALASDGSAAGTGNQVTLPNNSAYFFTGEVVSGVTGGGNTKGWTIEGVIKRGANAASTALVGTPTVTSTYADAGASTWIIAVTADTTNGGLRVTFTGQAGTTIRTVARISTVEMTY